MDAITPFEVLLAAVVLFALAVAFSRTVLPLWRHQRLRSKSRKWPSLRARLDHACVTEYRPSDTHITFRLDAWFTYTVEGKSYEGSYVGDDMRRDDAKRLLSRLNHEPVMITYNPAKPAEYFYQPPGRKSEEQ